MRQICADLAAEHAALDAMVAPLDQAGWELPTKADGWDVRDTVFHIAYFDDTARLAIVDPPAFAESTRLMLTGGGVDFAALARAMTGAELLAWWRTTRAELLAAAVELDPKARLPWYGPPMSALSFLTARLMETWSHAYDVADAVGATVVPTDRLKHIAHLGWVTRGWSYANRGLAVPTDPVRLELTAPSGDVWAWGPEDAADRVTGEAVDFCLAVTQRRRYDAVPLTIVGAVARDWMSKAQAFAGPATDTDADRTT